MKKNFGVDKENQFIASGVCVLGLHSLWGQKLMIGSDFIVF